MPPLAPLQAPGEVKPRAGNSKYEAIYPSPHTPLKRPLTHIYPFYNIPPHPPVGKSQGKANSKYEDVWPRKVIIAGVTMAKNAHVYSI